MRNQLLIISFSVGFFLLSLVANSQKEKEGRPVFTNDICPSTKLYVFWDEWYATARAGNENAVVTFNDGSFLTGKMNPVRPEHDFTSGEALVLIDSKIRIGLDDDSALFIPDQKYVSGTKCLYHILIPIDGYGSLNHSKFPNWANIPFDYRPPEDPTVMPAPIYSDKELIKFVKDFTKVGGAVTINVNISQEGYLSEKTIRQL